MGMRRKAREIAMQTLYSLSFEDTESYLGSLELLQKYPEQMDLISENNEIPEDSPIKKFASILVKGTITNLDEIDSIISNLSANWDFERIALLDKEILRIAIFEMKYTNTPYPIIMDEAIEISKKYCAEKTSKFINGILNAFAKQTQNNAK